jgi:hypothetical protein
MSSITLRSTKGSPLTNTEVDNNFSNLNTDKIESTYNGALNSLTGGSAITTVSSTTGITTGVWKATTISPLYGGTGVAQASASSTLTISGAFGTTFTVGATTALTLPASGTLATSTSTFTSGAIWNGNVITGTYGGTGVNNGSSTITIAGNVTHSGAYARTFTATGITSLTLPTTGTLATLAGSEAFTSKTYNGLTVTSSTGTLTITNGKTLSASNTLTFTGTDASSVAFGTGGTVLYSGGALGTPSSGTVTNLTGTASININGTVGATSVNTGAFSSVTATGNITAYYSDARLKTVSGKIENALDKVSKLTGVYYTVNDIAKSYGYEDTSVQVGVLAQDVESVLPEIVKPAPFDVDANGNSKSGENYKTVQYEKIIPLLIEAIKELQIELNLLKGE